MIRTKKNIAITLASTASYDDAIVAAKAIAAYPSLLKCYRNKDNEDFVVIVTSPLSVSDLSQLTGIDMSRMTTIDTEPEEYLAAHPELSPEHPDGHPAAIYVR